MVDNRVVSLSSDDSEGMMAVVVVSARAATVLVISRVSAVPMATGGVRYVRVSP